jgi:hypothetical protein
MAHSAAREWDRLPRQGPPPRRHAVGQSARDTHESSRIGTSPRPASTGNSTLRPCPERGRRPV